MINAVSSNSPISAAELQPKAAPQPAAKSAGVPTDTVTLSSQAHAPAATSGDVDHDGDSR